MSPSHVVLELKALAAGSSSHVSGEETKAKRGEFAYPRSHSWKAAEAEFTCRTHISDSRACAIDLISDPELEFEAQHCRSPEQAEPLVQQLILGMWLQFGCKRQRPRNGHF